jgi:hypothetical protein
MVKNRIDAKILIEEFRRQFNEVRPHSSLAQLTPIQFKRSISTNYPGKAILKVKMVWSDESRQVSGIRTKLTILGNQKPTDLKQGTFPLKSRRIPACPYRFPTTPTTRSKQYRRTLPIRRSMNGFCQGLRGAPEHLFDALALYALEYARRGSHREVNLLRESSWGAIPAALQ